jgi:hypothetical protein
MHVQFLFKSIVLIIMLSSVLNTNEGLNYFFIEQEILVLWKGTRMNQWGGLQEVGSLQLGYHGATIFIW